MRCFRGVITLEESEPIGFAYGLVFQWKTERRFYLKEMCMLGRKQRGGVGARLQADLMKKPKAENVRQISFGTGRDTPAKRFYTKLGFEIDPKVIIMNRRLRRPAAK